MADEGAEVDIWPRPRALSLMADEASDSEMRIPPLPLATRPRALFLLAARSVGDDDDYLNTSVQIAGNRPRSFLGGGSAGGPIYLRPAARPMFLHPMSGLPSNLTVGRCHFSSLAWTPRGPNKLGSWTKPQRSGQLPSVQRIARRNLSEGWCWTPWDRKNPMSPQRSTSPPKNVDEIVKMLKDLDLTDEDNAKLKEFFLDKFYSEAEDAEGTNLKLDLVLHRQGFTNKMLLYLGGKADKPKTKKWGSFTIWGRKVDLSTWVATVISLFLTGR